VTLGKQRNSHGFLRPAMEEPTQPPTGKTLKAAVGRHDFRLTVVRDVFHLSPEASMRGNWKL